MHVDAGAYCELIIYELSGAIVLRPPKGSGR